MAGLYKRGPVYYCDIYLHGRRTRKPLSTDRRIAEGKLADLINQRNAVKHNHAPVNMSWTQFKTNYLESSKREKKKTTFQTDTRALNGLDALYPIRLLSQATPALLAQVKAKWMDAGRGLYVVNRDIRAIKTAMHRAEALGYAQKQDWSAVKYQKEPKGRLHFHTPAQLGVLIKLLRRRPYSPLWLTVGLLGARAGLRREEMRMLEFSDCDFQNNRIHIAPKRGKDEAGKPYDWSPKDYERRWIPMAPDLREHLLAIKRKADSSWVLAQEGPRPSLGSMSAYFTRLTRKAGLAGSIHTLRHTFGSHLAQNGVSLRKIKEWMGHSTIQTTEIYAHLMPVGVEEKDIEKLPVLL